MIIGSYVRAFTSYIQIHNPTIEKKAILPKKKNSIKQKVKKTNPNKKIQTQKQKQKQQNQTNP